MKSLLSILAFGLSTIPGTAFTVVPVYQSGIAMYKENTVVLDITHTTVDSLISVTSPTSRSNDQYLHAWRLGTVSELYVFLNEFDKAEQYYEKAKSELLKLTPDSLIICVTEINYLVASSYHMIPNRKRHDTHVKFHELAISMLPKSAYWKTAMESGLIFFLTNSAATTWKYDYHETVKFFEAIRRFSKSMLWKGVAKPQKFILKTLKDPLRRYSRFMISRLYLSPNQVNRNLCESINCVESSWQVLQSLKSRGFRQQLFRNKLAGLNKSAKKNVLSNVAYLDSIYSSLEFYGDFIDNSFDITPKYRALKDSIESEITATIPELSSLTLDNLDIHHLQEILKPNEVYVSIMYTDNESKVYAWKIQKGVKPVAMGSLPRK